MKKIILFSFLFSGIFSNDIEVSQDTLMQHLNYGDTASRTITFTNNTANDIDLSITLVDQTWIPPLGRIAGQIDIRLPDTPSSLGFQEGLICGTPDSDPEDILITKEQVERWLEQQGRSSSRNIVNVQIAWHVIHTDNGTGYLSANQIAGQVTWLNVAFADHDFIFTLVSIDYTANNDWFYNMYDLDSQVKYALNIDPVHHMNVYTASIFSSGAAGYAYLPHQWTENSHNHGIVLDYRTLPYAAGYDGDVGTHEAGHYLGLNHTFQGNCTVTNDGVDDTPAHHDDYLWQCNNNLDSCPSMPGNDPVHNYMTYTSDACGWEFTPGQKDRMHAMVATYRPGLLENPVAPEWMTTADETVTVPANGTLDLGIDFDASSIYGGMYYADAIFTAETPDTSITVSATLDVTGFPQIGLDATVLTFDETYINDTSSVTLEITNAGSDDLFINALEFDHLNFFCGVEEISIGPGESEDLDILFVPDSLGEYNGNMTIFSNDESDPEVDVMLVGEGISSPLNLSFTTLVDTLEPNTVHSHLLTLSNEGNTTINYDIDHDIDWLTISSENGSIPVNENELIQFNINTLFMNYGEYSGMVNISTNVGQFSIEVIILLMELAIDDDLTTVPQKFEVHKNFPNPFNPYTLFQIDVPDKGHLAITVHDISGRLINSLHSGQVVPGYHRFQWDGKNNVGAPAASGVYILNVQLNGLHRSQKMLLVK